MLDANPEYVRLTGHRTQKEIIGKNVIEWTAGYEKEKNAEAVKKCAREGHIRNLEIDYVDLAGKVTPVEINATVVQIQGTVKILTLCRDITDRKRIEEALRTSEERFRGITERISDLIIVADPEGYMTFVSPSITSILGFPPEAYIRKRAGPDIIHPEDVVKIGQVMEKTKNGSPGEQVEFRMLKSDGSYAVFDGKGIPIFNQDIFAGVQIVARDITERKRAEEERERIRLWRAGVNRILEAILAPAPLDQKLKIITDGVVETFDADFCRIWLIEKGDLCTTDCMHAEVVEGPHICRFRDKCLHLKASSGRYTHIDGKAHRRVPFGAYKIGLIASGAETKFLTNDVVHDPRVHDHEWAENLGLVSFSGYRLKPPHGEVLGVFALFARFPISPDMDAILNGLSRAISLTIQKDNADQALAQSEERYRTLSEASPDQIFIVGRDDTMKYVNAAALKLFRLPYDQVMGTPRKNLFPPDIADAQGILLKKVFETGETGKNGRENSIRYAGIYGLTLVRCR